MSGAFTACYSFAEWLKARKIETVPEPVLFSYINKCGEIYGTVLEDSTVVAGMYVKNSEENKRKSALL